MCYAFQMFSLLISFAALELGTGITLIRTGGLERYSNLTKSMQPESGRTRIWNLTHFFSLPSECFNRNILGLSLPPAGSRKIFIINTPVFLIHSDRGSSQMLPALMGTSRVPTSIQLSAAASSPWVLPMGALHRCFDNGTSVVGASSSFSPGVFMFLNLLQAPA